MTTFIVEGRKFKNQLNAITFARHQAQMMDRSVKVSAETELPLRPGAVGRHWVATMHPPGVMQTILQPQCANRSAK